MARRRSPDRIRLHNIHNYVAIQLGNWLAPRPQAEFNLDTAIRAVGYDPENRHHRMKVYNVIAYWRKKAREVWDYAIENGKIKARAFAQTWGAFLNYYNKNFKAFYLLYDPKDKVYYQPNFSAKERLDQKRMERQAKGLKTVLAEMVDFDESLIVTGRPIREALQEADKFTRKYITDHTYGELEAGSKYTEEEEEILKSMKEDDERGDETQG
jgi:hypothetical protein